MAEYHKDIVLAIHPKFAEAILLGTKRFEFRRQRPGRLIHKRAYLYATSPVKAVVGWADVRLYEGWTTHLWQIAHDEAGMAEWEYLRYFGTHAWGTMLTVLAMGRYEPPKTLAEFDVQHPPQSWCYVGVLSMIGEEVIGP